MAATGINKTGWVGLVVGCIAFACSMLTSFVITDDPPEADPPRDVTVRIESGLSDKVTGLFSKGEAEEAVEETLDENAEEGGRIKGFVDAVKDKFRGEDDAATESSETTTTDSEGAGPPADAPEPSPVEDTVANASPQPAGAPATSIDLRRAIPRLLIALGVCTFVLGFAARLQGAPSGVPALIMCLGIATVVTEIVLMHTVVVAIAAAVILVLLFVYFFILGGGF